MARAADRPAHPVEKCDPWLCSGVRSGGCQGPGQDRTAIGADIARRELAGVGARVVCDPGPRLRAGAHPSRWLLALLKRKPPKLAAVALANKIARIAWKLMTTGEDYDGARMSGVSAFAA